MEDNEKDFNDWLQSIKFVDKDGKVILTKLEKDNSDDPENDRAEV